MFLRPGAKLFKWLWVEFNSNIHKYAGLFIIRNQDVEGGLALLWKHGITIWVDSFSQFHIDVIVHGCSADAWRFTGFYGAPDAQESDDEWALL